MEKIETKELSYLAEKEFFKNKIKKVPHRVNIVIDKNQSLDSISELVHNKGLEIVKTPHIGNKGMNEKIFATQGILQATFNRNQMYVDTADHPHLVRVNGQDLELATSLQDGVVTPFATIDWEDKEKIMELLGKEFTNPATLHHFTTQKEIQWNYELWDKYLYLRDNISEKILTILEKISEQDQDLVFWRYILDKKIIRTEPDHELLAKKTSKELVSDFVNLAQAMCHAVENDKTLSNSFTGPIPSNSYSVLVLALRSLFTNLEKKIENPNTVYTISGQSMYKYAKSLQNQLDFMYNVAKESFPELPEEINFHFIVGSAYDILPPENQFSKVELMNEIALEWLKIQENNKKMSQIWVDKQLYTKQNVDLRNKIAKLRWDLLKMETSFSSQYDVMLDRKNMPAVDHIAWIKQLSIQNIEKLFWS